MLPNRGADSFPFSGYIDPFSQGSKTILSELSPLEVYQLLNQSRFLCWGLTTRQPLWVILCRLPEKGRKDIEEIVQEMKERVREERGTGMKVKKQKK